MLDSVNPFIGTEAMDLPSPEGIASTWFTIKARIANTHPGAVLPFSVVSAAPYSGGYPTGYGRYDVNTHGAPGTLYPGPRAFGVTHVHHSGTGYIRRFYNYLLVVPRAGEPRVPHPDLGRSTPLALADETASPGYYAASLPASGVRLELTVAHQAAAHRYTSSAGLDAGLGVLVDVTNAGLAPERARSRVEAATVVPAGTGARGRFLAEGVWWYYAAAARSADETAEASPWTASERSGDESAKRPDSNRTGAGRAPDGWLPVTRHDSQTPLELDTDACSRTRAGVLLQTSGDRLDVYVGLSLASEERAVEYAEAAAERGFDRLRADAARAWEHQLGRVRVDGGTGPARRVFATAAYHASIKPARCEPANFLWRDGPELWADVATMWDQYKTQLPFVAAANPEHMMRFVRSYLRVREVHGSLPNSILFSTDLSSNENQSRNLAVVTMCDFHRHLAALGEADPGEWSLIAPLLASEVEREHAAVRPGSDEQGYSHRLDVSYAAGCVAELAAVLGLGDVVERMLPLRDRWVDAFDPGTGMVRTGSFYEGDNVHYSFRLLHDMAARVRLSGGPDAFVAALDRFFGFGAPPARQIGDGMTQAAGMALGRFDALNNEVMLETPFAYHYVGRPDRTSEVVHAIQTYAWSDSPGGMPGNDDSGGLSSWYVWNAAGLYPVPGQDLLFVSVPLFDRARIGADTVTVVAERDAPGAIYLEALELDGRPLDRSFITVREFRTAGVLRVRLTANPGRFVPALLPGGSTVRDDGS